MTAQQMRIGIVSLVALISAAGFATFLLSRPAFESPTVERLSALTGVKCEIELRPEHYPPYEFLIGVPGSSSSAPRFSGSISIEDSKGNHYRIPIDSKRSSWSNWLPGSAETGYILTFGKKPALDTIVTRGTPSHIQITFDEPPPSGSSFWFSSMRHLSLFGH